MLFRCQRSHVIGNEVQRGVWRLHRGPEGQQASDRGFVGIGQIWHVDVRSSGSFSEPTFSTRHGSEWFPSAGLCSTHSLFLGVLVG